MSMETLLKETLVLPEDLNAIGPEKRKLLENLQGNILKAHGRSHAAHVFIQFGDNANRLKEQINKLAQMLTSAFQQEEQTKRWNDSKQDGGCFLSFLLSYSGYQRLGVREDNIPDDPIFRTGMRSNDETYFRWSQDGWSRQFGERVDAMVLAADNDHGRLLANIELLKSELTKEALAESFKIHWGSKRVDNKNRPVEWFGFRDDLGQPRLATKSGSQEPTPEWNTLAPLNLALAVEPGGAACGSYMAFQKLEQNVKRFRLEMNRLAEQLGGAAVDDVSALAIGRYRDGRPLIATKPARSGEERDALNNFNYDNDRDGKRCPFHAHIRKVNPRGEIGCQDYPAQLTTAEERELQIIRRGIPYDDRGEDEKRQNFGEPPESGVGLLFMSYQRELAQFLAKLWMAMSDNFVRQRVGPDPLLARGSSGNPQEWRRNGFAVRQRLSDFVTLRGGEYFFAPSISFLKNLS
jgi:Dyp-type peroxidase family